MYPLNYSWENGFLGQDDDVAAMEWLEVLLVAPSQPLC